MVTLTGRSKCFHFRKAWFLHAYDYSIARSSVPVSIRLTKNKWLYLAFHYETENDGREVWNIINTFGDFQWYRDKMDVSDWQLQAETVEMSREDLVTYLEAHRAERLKTDGPTSKSVVEYEFANRVLPKPSDIQDTIASQSKLKHEKEEAAKLKREKEEAVKLKREKEEAETKQRAKEEAEAKQCAEEERKGKIRSNREAASVCIMCGESLDFFQKLWGTKKHKECTTFTE